MHDEPKPKPISPRPTPDNTVYRYRPEAFERLFLWGIGVAIALGDVMLLVILLKYVAQWPGARRYE